MTKAKQEKEDKKWVNFYYFWKLQYEVRRYLIKYNENTIEEIDKLKNIVKLTGCEKLNNCLSKYKFGKNDFLNFNKIYDIPCNLVDNSCINCKHNPVINGDFKYLNNFNLSDVTDKYIFERKQLILDSCDFLVELLKLHNHDPSNEEIYNYYVHNTPVRRIFDTNAIEIIGCQNLSLNKRHLNGKVIAKIDLSSPKEAIINRFIYLKKLEYENVPSFDELNKDLNSAKYGYTNEKRYIEALYKPNLMSLDFGQRALGLWLFDVIHSDKSYFAEAFRLLERGETKQGIKSPGANSLSLTPKASAKTIERAYKVTAKSVMRGEVLGQKKKVATTDNHV